jgi:hypothetical protein
LSRASAAFEPLPAAQAEAVLDHLEARFGLADALADHRFWHRPGTPSLWLAHASLVPPPTLRTESVGLCAFRDPPPRGKPTNVFIQRFGHRATRGCVELPEALSGPFLQGDELSIADTESRGWVIVRVEGRALGRAWLEAGRLVGEMKRAWREGLSA